MSSQFSTQLVKDKRLDLKSSANFGVYRGAQSIFFNDYAAVSEGLNQINFNIQIPSDNIIVCRHVLFESQITLKLFTSSHIGVDYGYTDAFCSFPLHAMMQSMTVMINNCTISSPMQDVLCIIMRMMDQRELGNYEGGTPSFQDQYFNYEYAYTAINNPLGSYKNAVQYEFVPRGSFNLVYLGDLLPNNVTVNGVTGTGVPPGFQTIGAVGVQRDVYVVAKFVEPLLISPFVFGENWNAAGLLGIQTINCNFNIGQVNRIWREVYAGGVIPTNTTLMQVEKSKLYFVYLSPHPSDLIEAKNVVPYYEIVPYKTNFTFSTGQTGSQEITSNNYQLSTIPDKLFYLVRPNITECDMTIADIYTPIENINIQWNARSGLLSNATMYQLWEMSRNSGCHMSWLEWSGQFAMHVLPVGFPAPATIFNSTYTVGQRNGQPFGCGSILVLDMVRFVSVLEDYLSSGSVGSYSLQTTMRINVPTNGVSNIPSNRVPYLATWELVTAVMNSGIFVTHKGSSSINMNLLSKQDVLNTVSTTPVFDKDLVRAVGGNFSNSIVKWLANPANLSAINQLAQQQQPQQPSYSRQPEARYYAPEPRYYEPEPPYYPPQRSKSREEEKRPRGRPKKY